MSNDRLNSESVTTSRILAWPNCKVFAWRNSGKPQKNLNKNSWCLSQYFNPGPPKQSGNANHLAVIFVENMTTQNSVL
jgi:hypothetical protein